MDLIISNDYLVFNEDWTNGEKIIQAVINKKTGKISTINLEKCNEKYSEVINNYLKDDFGNYQNNVIARPNIDYKDSAYYKINELPLIEAEKRLNGELKPMDKVLQRLPY